MRYSTNECPAARLTFVHCNLFEGRNECIFKRENLLAKKWRRSMFSKALAKLSVATVIAIGGASVFATVADAHQRPANRAVQIEEVWVGNEFVGRDTDPNVRLELLRTYGQLGGA
jgi:hypothetical protein